MPCLPPLFADMAPRSQPVWPGLTPTHTHTQTCPGLHTQTTAPKQLTAPTERRRDAERLTTLLLCVSFHVWKRLAGNYDKGLLADRRSGFKLRGIFETALIDRQEWHDSARRSHQRASRLHKRSFTLWYTDKWLRIRLEYCYPAINSTGHVSSVTRFFSP